MFAQGVKDLYEIAVSFRVIIYLQTTSHISLIPINKLIVVWFLVIVKFTNFYSLCTQDITWHIWLTAPFLHGNAEKWLWSYALIFLHTNMISNCKVNNMPLRVHFFLPLPCFGLICHDIVYSLFIFPLWQRSPYLILTMDTFLYTSQGSSEYKSSLVDSFTHSNS